MKKYNLLKFLKFLIILIFGYKNIYNLRIYVLRFLKNIPIFHYYDKEAKKAKKIIIGKKNSEVFFGYYDITPFDQFGNKVLCHVYNQKKKNDKNIYLGYADINFDKDPNIKIFSKTETWCWQMGSRLQWYPSNCGNLVIFNTMNKFCLIINFM